MIPYYFLIAFPVLLRIISKKYRVMFGERLIYETPTASIDVFMFIFLLLLALRGTACGNDTVQYLRIFHEYSAQHISQLISSQKHELCYKLLNRLVGFLGGEYQILLAITAVMCIYPLWYFYKRESENQLLTIALFLTVAPFVMYFSGIRQSIAMSMGIWAWFFAKEKKRLRFVLLVLLAMQFHRSAVALFALYPIYHMKITRRWLWVVIPCMVVVYVLKTQIFAFLMRFLWEEYGAIVETGAITVLILLVLFGIYSYVIPDERSMDKDTVAMRNMLLFSIVFQFFAMLHPLAMRVNYYFLIYIPILIPKIASRSRERYRQIANLSVVIMTVFFLCYFINNGLKDNDDLNIFPYIPFWH